MIVVTGIARSGIAAARLLKSRGLDVFVSDAGAPPDAAQLQDLGIPFETGGHTTARFTGAEMIVVSPGVPLDIPPLAAARLQGIPVIGELELASRYLRGRIVAVTGSNGKTTTTSLIASIVAGAGLRMQVGGNIGTPLSALVDTSTDDTVNVVEVSSFQLDTATAFRPHVGVLLNITPDHLDRYAGFEAYRLSKFRMFARQTAEDVAVVNSDDPQVDPPPVRIVSRILPFSRRRPLPDGAAVFAERIRFRGADVMAVADIPLRGPHNVENVLAAVAATASIGIGLDRIAESVRQFKAVEHRLEFVRSIRGVEFFNDSKATNVDSAVKAVESFPGNLILILGGKDKGSPYEPLVEAMLGRVRHVVLIGAAAPKIGDAIGSRIETRRASSLEDAVRQSLDLGRPGDVVLLSPACASFDIFDNYEHRGRAFKEVVVSLAEQATRGGV